MVYSSFKTVIISIELESESFFCNGPAGKYFRFLGLQTLSWLLKPAIESQTQS